MAGVTEIPVETIKANPDQPRRHFDEAELEELAQSIREKGVLQPILVRPAVFAGEFQIVAGERRWRAAQRAGIRAIPALVRSLSDEEVLEIAIVENVQRKDLSAMEEADGYRTLIDKFGRTQAQVADTVGKSRVHVANALRLLQLPDSVQAMVRDGQLTPGHVRPLIGVADAARLAEENRRPRSLRAPDRNPGEGRRWRKPGGPDPARRQGCRHHGAGKRPGRGAGPAGGDPRRRRRRRGARPLRESGTARRHLPPPDARLRAVYVAECFT